MDYILENDVLKLECTEKGGEMLHLVKKSTNHETLYQGDQGWSGRNPSLFPMVGNTYTKDYKIDGKKYAMKNHGLIHYATLKGESKEDELVFCLDANEETLAQYPFNFHFEIGYKLDGNKVLIQYHVKNNDSKDMPFGFGLHPAFKLDDEFSTYTLASFALSDSIFARLVICWIKSMIIAQNIIHTIQGINNLHNYSLVYIIKTTKNKKISFDILTY